MSDVPTSIQFGAPSTKRVVSIFALLTRVPLPALPSLASPTDKRRRNAATGPARPAVTVGHGRSPTGSGAFRRVPRAAVRTGTAGGHHRGGRRARGATYMRR
ncbi:hypothetical protein JCM4814A_41910 [Streptomyces phaeofaciens JCM 4814]|uniref:Uncharacterized protein n=1 Tax=Streptomyces phaeofaciens TaxID=68254 RepID=A0A918LZZ0_9ACTN|nr:hypothetical protein GCM10010226_69960 [Streptomyces phaeofaciens]